jgi:hypothetical protein
MSKKFKTIKKKIVPQGGFILNRGFVATIAGRMLNPGDKFTADELTPKRLAELKDKGLIRGSMTTEEKGTITK